MNSILDIVKQRPLAELPSATPKCPFCQSAELSGKGTLTTLLGGGDGTPDGDPNHTWTEYVCWTCNGEFTRETKRGNVWYTKDRRVLAGVPSCFETYIYSCADCGGDIVRQHAELDGSGLTRQTLGVKIVDGRHIRDYRTFFRCRACGKQVETATDHWVPA